MEIEQLNLHLDIVKARMEEVVLEKDPDKARALLVELLVMVVQLEGFISDIRKSIQEALLIR